MAIRTSLLVEIIRGTVLIDCLIFNVVLEQVLQYCEPNWENIVTPIKVEVLGPLLREAGYDTHQTETLVKGFTKGFDIGYRGPKVRRHTADNLPFRIGSKTEMWNKIMKEVKEGRYAGPFLQPPCDNYVQSPLGLVPKAGNKTRLIFHLSYDFGQAICDKSVNYHTPDELCTVKYKDLDHAVRNCLNLLKYLGESNTGVVVYCKTDCSNAFRLVPVLVCQRFVLIMMAEHPLTNVKYYFVDKCLPFGSSRSCAIFQEFSDALAFLTEVSIVKKNICSNPALTNYLDDFLFMALQTAIANGMLREFLHLCSKIGCPISVEKTEWASPIMVFLGTLLNGKEQVISVPIDKVEKTYQFLQYAIQKRKVTVKFVQQLTGLLNFLHWAIVPGRAFTRGMYHKLKLTNSQGVELKQHHHIYLNNNFVQDCQVWMAFLCNVERVQLCRPFSDFNPYVPYTVLKFASDAALSGKLGFGAVFEDRWLWGKWNPDFIRNQKPSIEFLELFALTIGLTAWKEELLSRGRIAIFCDNEAVMHMVNNYASSCMQCMKLIRVIALQGIAFSHRVRVLYIRSKQNILPDALSRLDFKRFWRAAPASMHKTPTNLPEQLWPVEQVWNDSFNILNFKL